MAGRIGETDEHNDLDLFKFSVKERCERKNLTDMELRKKRNEFD